MSLKDFYEAKIMNSGHASFMDIPLMIDIPSLNEAGTINSKTAHNIINKTVVSFFDKYLKNKNIDLLNLNNIFSELEIKLEKQ